MRITNSMLYRTGVSEVQRQRSRLATTQEQASTGLRINRPSDDPVGTRAAMLLRESIAQGEQYQDTIAKSRARISRTEQALSASFDVVVRARVAALNGANATSGPTQRAILADEVESMRVELLSEANTRVDGGYVFSGFASSTQAFADNPPPVGVVFQGDSNEIQVDIDDGVQIKVGLDGRRVFLGDGDGDGSPDAGRVDIFDALADLRDALRADDTTNIQNAIDQLDTAQDQINRERTVIGLEDSKADLWEDRHQLRDVELRGQLSLVEDADSVEVFSNLVQQEAALTSSLEVTARLLQPSLLDFL